MLKGRMIKTRNKCQTVLCVCFEHLGIRSSSVDSSSEFRHSSFLSALLLPLLWLAGCAGSGRVYPPVHPSDPVTVYLTDYGRHSTLMFPAGPSRLVEYEWGDWIWMAYNQRDMSSASRAMVLSGCSAFSRRFIEPAKPTAAAVRSAIYDEAQVTALLVDRPTAETLRRTLDDRFLRDANTLIFNPVDGCCMARDPAHYSVFYNCNHLTAEWLRELGCRVEGDTTLSKFEVVASPDPNAESKP